MYEDFEQQAEGFSGANGELDLDASGGQSEATGLALERTQSAYKVNITLDSTDNTTDAGKIVLFGRDKNLTETNYGSGTGVTIASAYANTTYAELLNQSAIKPFSVNLVRMRVSNTSVFDYVMSLFSKDANGQRLEIPLDASNYYSPRQFNDNLIDVPFQFQIDSNNSIEWTIPNALFYGVANITMSLTFFPMATVNTSRLLSGGNVGRTYEKPNVPTVMPVKGMNQIQLPYKR